MQNSKKLNYSKNTEKQVGINDKKSENDIRHASVYFLSLMHLVRIRTED